MYPALKNVHVLAVGLSVALFALRGGLMLAGSPLLRARVFRILPHAVDSVLLAAGIGLAFVLRQVPGVSPWLTAKLVALCVYIVLGSIALKYGRTKRVRVLAFGAAIVVLIYIVGVALNKDPWSWLSP